MEHGIRWFDDGVVVTDVAEDSPAQRAGFREGMLLSHLRGRPTTSIERFETIIAELAGTVEATVVKKGAAGATESRLEIEGETETLAEEASDES
jgi:S1-C subfamily serine protease